jgi:hypothetical protein
VLHQRLEKGRQQAIQVFAPPAPPAEWHGVFEQIKNPAQIELGHGSAGRFPG